MPRIEPRDVSKYCCRQVNLTVADKELLVLWGPNGAGKTTLLNVIAGLTDYEGSVLFDGEPVDTLPANKTGVGYLFQRLALFPHLDVTANVAYGLKAKREPQNRVKDRVKELLEMLDICHLAKRYPRELSGGERQRVALARALAPSPRILLLDEPLTGLDAKSALRLRAELKEWQQERGGTMIYVTHNQAEAKEIADRTAYIEGGRIERKISILIYAWCRKLLGRQWQNEYRR